MPHCPAVDRRLFGLHELRQLFLLRFIPGGQLQKPFMKNRTRYIVLVNALEDTVELKICFAKDVSTIIFPPYYLQPLKSQNSKV